MCELLIAIKGHEGVGEKQKALQQYDSILKTFKLLNCSKYQNTTIYHVAQHAGSIAIWIIITQY